MGAFVILSTILFFSLKKAKLESVLQKTHTTNSDSGNTVTNISRAQRFPFAVRVVTCAITRTRTWAPGPWVLGRLRGSLRHLYGVAVVCLWLPAFVCSCPPTKSHELKKEKSVFSQFWRLEARHGGASVVGVRVHASLCNEIAYTGEGSFAE